MTSQQALNLINPAVRSLNAYHLEPEATQIKLNQNENPYDWPQDVKEEIARFCIERPLNRYPTFVPEGLKELLAQYVGVKADQVIVGNGSNEMLLVLMLAFCQPGRKVIISQPTFTVYRLLTRGLDGVEIPVMMNPDLSFNVPALIAAVSENPGAMLILCSPNNPTGTVLTEQEIRSILDKHTGLALLDQAYIEFGGFNALALLNEYPNLIITRTFSKAMAAAGLRTGYMIGSSAMIAEIYKIKLPYNINFFSEFTASLLLKRRSVMADKVIEQTTERDRLIGALKKLPFDNVYPSQANFILVRTTQKDAYFAAIKKAGILLRDVSSYAMLDNCIRIGVGTPHENNALLTATEQFFCRA